jgi:hypothetical protein
LKVVVLDDQLVVLSAVAKVDLKVGLMAALWAEATVSSMAGLSVGQWADPMGYCWVDQWDASKADWMVGSKAFEKVASLAALLVDELALQKAALKVVMMAARWVVSKVAWSAAMLDGWSADSTDVQRAGLMVASTAATTVGCWDVVWVEKKGDSLVGTRVAKSAGVKADS